MYFVHCLACDLSICADMAQSRNTVVAHFDEAFEHCFVENLLFYFVCNLAEILLHSLTAILKEACQQTCRF